jgi:hypothetical protein
MPPRIGLIVIGVAAVLAVLVVIFVIEREDDAFPEEEVAAEEAVFVELPQRNDSGQWGTAQLEPIEEGRTRVTLELTLPPVGPQPARITEGDCEEPSASVHALEPVEGSPDTDEPGRSETELDVAFDDLLDRGLVIEVDRLTGGDELAVCGGIDD